MHQWRLINCLLVLMLLVGCGGEQQDDANAQLDSLLRSELDEEIRMPFQTEPISARDLDELLKDVPVFWHQLYQNEDAYYRSISCGGVESCVNISAAMGAVLHYQSNDTIVYSIIDCSYASSDEEGEDERHHYAFTLGGDDNQELQSELVFIPNGMSYWTGLGTDDVTMYCSYMDSAEYKRVVNVNPCP